MKHLEVRSPSRQRGVISFDVAVGLGITAVLIVALSATKVQQSRTAKAMEARRDAARQLEWQAGRLQAGQAINNPQVSAERIDPSWIWLRQPVGNGQAELLVFAPQAPTQTPTEASP